MSRLSAAILVVGLMQTTLAAGSPWQGFGPSQPSAPVTRRVNAPFLTSGAPYTPAIMWLGKVDTGSNYADVRVDYTPDGVDVIVHIIDRRLWNETTPIAANLPVFDSVSLYLDSSGNSGSTPSPSSYRLEVEVGNNFQASYRGDGAAWMRGPIAFSSSANWRGAKGPNSNSDSEGWVATFFVPYASLGLSGAPSQGTQWGFAVVVHSRDDAAGLVHQDTFWPETANPLIPATWGQLSFGWPAFGHPNALPSTTVSIREGLNGAHVVDGAVGGYTTCGNMGANKWTDWGNRNYSSPSTNYQFNIQNEWDISDWPCFSKFYITFPVGSIPAGQVLLSASLTLNLLGTAGGGPYGSPPKSFIEVLTVGQDWDPATLTWNNAPLAVENISGSWVNPVVGAYSWDVSRAVAQAYAANGPLRLALYSIDGDYHTGKYFFSSESTDWNGTTRPTLTIVFGNPCSSPDTNCHFIYMPITQH